MNGTNIFIISGRSSTRGQTSDCLESNISQGIDPSGGTCGSNYGIKCIRSFLLFLFKVENLQFPTWQFGLVGSVGFISFPFVRFVSVINFDFKIKILN